MNKAKSIIFLCLAVICFGCGRKNKNESEQTISVKTCKAEPYSEDGIYSYSAKVIASDEFNIAFRQSGTIETIPVKVGQNVNKGDIIAILDTRDYKTQLSSTESQYNQIRSEVERLTVLHKKGSVTTNNYEKAVAGLEQITAQLKAHKDALNDCYLKASSNGKIENINFKKGETVSAGMPVISMIDSNRPEVEIFVPAETVSILNSSKAIFENNEIYKLSLVSVAPKANAGGLYRVKYVINQGNSNLLVGNVGKVLIFENKIENNPLMYQIPVDAVFEKDNQKYVWIYDDINSSVKAKKIVVKKILNNGNIVVEGLKAGADVVCAGINSIDENMKVRVLPQTPESNVGGVK